MTNKRKTIQILSVLIYLAMTTCLVMSEVHTNRELNIDGNSPLTYFWNIQLGGVDSSLIFDAMTMILLTTFSAYLYIYIKNNQSFVNVQQRIGYKLFIQKAVVRSFLSGFLLSVFSKIYQVILIISILKKFPSNVIFEQTLIQPPFNDNTLISWSMFVLLSSIGWGVYAIFILSIGLFIKKNSVFMIIGAVIGTLLIVGPAMLLIDKSLAFFLTVILLPSLVTPGQMNFIINNGHDYNVYFIFILSVTLYTSISLLIIKNWINQTQKNG